MEDFLKYVDEFYPEVKQEFIRKTTPFYYEPNVFYRWLDDNNVYELINGTYLKNGDITLHLKSISEYDISSCSVKLSEAHTKIRRVDDEYIINGDKIPNSKGLIYINVDGRDYTISQKYSRDHNTGRLNGRIRVTCEQDKSKNKGFYHVDPYYELYSVIGKGEWNLKHMYDYDSREKYEIMYNISVKEFKSYVFGRHDVKLKCQLFGE